MDGHIAVVPAGGTIGFERDLMHGALAVVQDGARIGVIVDGGSDWLNGPKPATTVYRVADAGPAIPAPTGTFSTPDAAKTAIVEARRVHRAWLEPGAGGLTEFDRRALAFEVTPDAEATDGRREKAIGELFNGIHPTAYLAQLGRLLADRADAAHAANPAAYAALQRRMTRNRTRRRAVRPRPARGIGSSLPGPSTPSPRS